MIDIVVTVCSSIFQLSMSTSDYWPSKIPSSRPETTTNHYIFQLVKPQKLYRVEGTTEWLLDGGIGVVCKSYLFYQIFDMQVKRLNYLEISNSYSISPVSDFNWSFLASFAFLDFLSEEQSNSDQWWQSQWLVVISWLKEARESLELLQVSVSSVATIGNFTEK